MYQCPYKESERLIFSARTTLDYSYILKIGRDGASYSPVVTNRAAHHFDVTTEAVPARSSLVFGLI